MCPLAFAFTPVRYFYHNFPSSLSLSLSLSLSISSFKLRVPVTINSLDLSIHDFEIMILPISSMAASDYMKSCEFTMGK